MAIDKVITERRKIQVDKNIYFILVKINLKSSKKDHCHSKNSLCLSRYRFSHPLISLINT